MKKLINDPQDLVLEMCTAMVRAHPQLELNRQYKVLSRRQKNPAKVNLISGGGSGHEPAHGGFVGYGMLDAAVCGDVFASPSQVQVYGAIRELASEKGTLLVIKNYSGDVMNFKNAAALAQEDGLEVDYVVVNDDIAVNDSLYTVGRRGVAGTIFVHKIAGAAAEEGRSLAEVKTVAEKVVAKVRSIGFALSSCTVPAKGSPTFQLGEGEIEYGVGIHGEPGIERRPMATANQLARTMVDQVLADLGDRVAGEVAVLINGFGATPLQELYLFSGAVQRELDQRKLSVVHTMVGNYMTSIDMEGASLSILSLDPELKSYLAEACDTPAYRWNGRSLVASSPDTEAEDYPRGKAGQYTVETDEQFRHIIASSLSLGNVQYMVDLMAQCIIENEQPFCELDSHAGDGDFGMSVAKGFRKLKDNWVVLTEQSTTIGDFLDRCSLIIMEHCGGASGPIWGSGFRAAGKYAGDHRKLDLDQMAIMMKRVVEGIQKTGERSFGRGAVVGDKTLIDALVPAAQALEEAGKKGLGFDEAFKIAAEAAVAGAKSTEGIAAKMGRAGTVGDRSLGHPDAGAHALGVIFTYIAEAMEYSA